MKYLFFLLSLICSSAFAESVKSIRVSPNDRVVITKKDGDSVFALPPVTNMSDELATELGYKEYTQADVSITPGEAAVNSITIANARFIPYQVSNGNWRMKFNIDIGSMNTTGSFTGWDFAAIAGVTAPFNQAVSHENSANRSANAFFTTSGKLSIRYATASSPNGTSSLWSGDVALSAKPTWAN